MTQNYKLTSPELISAQQHFSAFDDNGFKLKIEERTDPDTNQTFGVAVISAMPYSENTSFTVDDFYELLTLITSNENVLGEAPSENSKPTLLRRANMRPTKIRRMLASRACRRSVMVGTLLNHREMTEIVHHLSNLHNPWACPHGRPTIRLLIKIQSIH